MLDSKIELSPEGDENITLKEFILKFTRAYNYLKTKWILVLATACLGLLLGMFYALRQKPVYEATVTFALQDDQIQGGAGLYSGLAGQLGMDVSTSGSGPFEGNNVLNLLKSRSLIEKTLLTSDKYHGRYQTLAETYIQCSQLRKEWAKNSRLANVQFLPKDNPDSLTLAQDSLLKTFYMAISKNYLTIEKVEDATSIISLTFKANDQIFAKLFAEKLVKNVSDFYIATKTQKTLENVKILQHQSDSVRKAMNRDIYGVAANYESDPNPNPNMQSLHVGAQRKNFDVQVNQTMLAELIRNLETAKVTLRKETPLIQVIDKPKLPLDVKNFNKVKGMLIGFFLGAAIATAWLLTKRFLSKVMSE